MLNHERNFKDVLNLVYTMRSVNSKRSDFLRQLIIEELSKQIIHNNLSRQKMTDAEIEALILKIKEENEKTKN